MSQFFLHLCKIILNQPNINIDVEKFIPNFDIYNLDDDGWVLYNRFLNPLIYKIHECKKMCIPVKERRLKIEFYVNMQKPIHNIFHSDASSDYNDLIKNRYPRVISKRVDDLYMKCQRHYHSLIRFINIVKTRYSQSKNTCDLLLRPISDNDKHLYSVLQNGSKYLFRVSELQQIIITCIGNTDEYFPEVLVIKNPYNNEVFSWMELYRFYFYIKTHNYKLEELYHSYFISDFQDDLYVLKYEVIIRDRAITSHVKNAHYDSLYPDVLRMLIQYKSYIPIIQISCGFPRKALVDIMRPYLHLYYYHLHFPQDLPRRYESEEKLIKKLIKLSVFNSTFGKRTVSRDEDKQETIVKYSSVVPAFNKPIYSNYCTPSYITISLADDDQYHKMMAFFKSTSMCLSQLTGFTSSDQEEEYGYYVDRYYTRYIRSRLRREETDDMGDDDIETDCTETVVDDDGGEDNSTVTSLDSDDEIEPREASNLHQQLQPAQVYPENVTLVSALRTPVITTVSFETMLHSSMNYTMQQHDEIVNRAMSTLNDVTERLDNLRFPDRIHDTSETSSSCAMSISEDEPDSVNVETSTKNTQEEYDTVNEETSSDTDPDIDVRTDHANLLSSNQQENANGKYIVRAMTGSRDIGYTTELSETFYTGEVATRFYEELGLIYYDLKEIEFIPFDLLDENRVDRPATIINCEEKPQYYPSNYTNNIETNHPTEEPSASLNMFSCNECKLKSIKNQCCVCKECDICNYCNGENVWSKQHEDWKCRSCYNAQQQEENENAELDYCSEEEIISSSLMTYGVPSSAIENMSPDEYIHSRMEEMKRQEYLERGFTEEDYCEMQDLRFEEYGSDGEDEA